MSQSDFQERLDRLHKPRWIIVLALILSGGWIASFANEEYDMIKTTYGVKGALLAGSCARVLLSIGSIFYLRALWNQFKPNR